MVYLAGPADGLLLDPCCGTGVVLAEAAAAGWAAAGTDSSADLLDQARAAAPGADVSLGDAREILEPDDSVAACVSRLPPAASDGGWLGSALAEMSRVTRSDGAVILLAPEIPRTVLPGALRLRRQIPVRLADGQQVWVFRRR
jgi:SAM-dependent methyltransferase